MSTPPLSKSGRPGWTSILNISRRLAVVGDPIEHSRSPQLHMAAYEVLGLDWSYERVRVRRGELREFVATLDESWQGLSVTMPLKHEARALAAVADAPSTLTDGANTLVLSAASTGNLAGAVPGSAHNLSAFNTDVAGLVNPLRRAGFASVSHAVIVGAGATASSALVALRQLECDRVAVAVRNPDRAHDVAALGSRLGIAVTVATLDELASCTPAPVTISTVPGASGVSLEALARPVGGLLFDIAYDVWPSRNSQEWVASGGVVVSGLSMLAAQALEQVRIFVTGSATEPLPHEERVRVAMNSAVGLDESGLIPR